MFRNYFYRFIIIPVIVLAAGITSLFSKKIRKGFFPRLKTHKRIEKILENQKHSNPKILFHAASLGEFEHIRPILEQFKKRFGAMNIVSFFSPSGFEHAEGTPCLDGYFYMPLDSRRNWCKVYHRIKPEMLIVSKHDVWPEMINTARNENIPAFLINASLAENSSRTRGLTHRLLKSVYPLFQNIFAISDEDAKRFNKYFPGSKVIVSGDTKYDQVLLRKDKALQQSKFLENWARGNWIFVAGSIWPEDQTHLLPALRDFMEVDEKIKLVLVPHQPSEKAITEIREFFGGRDIARFSQDNQLTTQRIFIMDSIGYLAALYHHANAAYVGGSFQQGVHNVMEPAVYGVPVLYGPVHRNSYEAIRLSEGNGGFVVKNQQEIIQCLKKIYEDEYYCKKMGKKAETFSMTNTGATEKLMSAWEEILKQDRNKG